MDWFTKTTPEPEFDGEDDGLSLGPDTFADGPVDLPLAPAPGRPAPVARLTRPVSSPPATPAPLLAASRPVGAALPAPARGVQPAQTRVSPPTRTAASAPPPIAETFAALLAAELNEPVAAVAPTWPIGTAPPSIDTNELVDQVVERVLTRLSDRVVRETVGELVSKVAERLVQEEIDRIKSSTK